MWLIILVLIIVVFFNSSWISDAIWRHRSGLTLAQLMACCLTAPSHYLNQCWLIISGVKRVISLEIQQWWITKTIQTIPCRKCHSNFSGATELTHWPLRNLNGFWKLILLLYLLLSWQVSTEVDSSTPQIIYFVDISQYYSDVIMSGMVSHITSLTIIYSTVYSGADQRNHQSTVSLAFVWGIHRWPVNSPHKGSVTRQMLLFDDVIMARPKKQHLMCYLLSNVL